MYLGAGGGVSNDPAGQLGYHGVADPHLNGGLSLQEMIDTDIKAEFDDVLQNNPLTFQGMDSLELLNDLDSIAFLGSAGNQAWTTTPVTTQQQVQQVQQQVQQQQPLNSQVHHLSHYSSNSSPTAFSNSYLEDMTGSASVMVNPNNVMPIQPLQHQQVTGLSVNTHVNGHMSPQPSSPLASPIYGGQSLLQQQQQHMPPAYSGRPSKSVRVLPPVSSPMQQVPSPSATATNSSRKKNQKNTNNTTTNNTDKENGYPKPAYSYSCLIALALKNSQTGSMSVSEIYKFMCEHFPYFKNAPSGWKNSVRHNLSLNKCFEKIEKPTANGNQRKGCLWAMNPNKVQKMNEEVQKWSRKDPQAIKKGMAVPESLTALERGDMKKDYNANTTGAESEDEDDPRTPTSVSSQGSQGYDSAGSDFATDIEGFSHITPLPDTSMPELNLQASGGGVYDELGDDRLNFGPATVSDVVVTSAIPSASVVSGVDSFYPTTIRANYSIAPATTMVGGHQKTYHTIVNVSQKNQHQKVFSTT